MNASILKMSDIDTVRFIELYENESVLWDPINPKYKEKDAREAAAKRIADRLNIKKFTASHVIMKFKNLRSSYSQELKKIARTTKSGTSADDVYVPKVIWFSKMNGFLRPHVRAGKTQTNLQATETDNTESMETLAEWQVRFHEQPSTSYDEKNASLTQSHAEFSQNSEKAKKRPSEAVAHHQNVKAKNDMDLDNNIDLTFRKLDDILKTAAQILATKDDQFDTFGKYIASMLRNIPKQSSFLLQQEITSLVLREQMKISTPTPTMNNINAEIGQVFSPVSVKSDYSLSEL